MTTSKKTNIDYLEDMIDQLTSKTLSVDAQNKMLENMRNVISNISVEVTNYKNKIDSLEDTVRDLEENLEAPSGDKYFVGLDTVYLFFEQGNLLIKSKFDDFVKKLQIENCVTA